MCIGEERARFKMEKDQDLSIKIVPKTLHNSSWYTSCRNLVALRASFNVVICYGNKKERKCTSCPVNSEQNAIKC